MPRLILLALAFLLAAAVAPTALAQHEPRRAGEMIVRLTPEASMQAFSASHALQQIGFVPVRNLVPMLNIWLVQFDEEAVQSGHQALDVVRAQSDVQVAQFNHVVELRSPVMEMPEPLVAPMPRSPLRVSGDLVFPNDPRFGEMWGLWNTGQSGGTVGADVKAPMAWAITTGEGASDGRDIVVAIVDSGFDLNHADLPYWKNTAESTSPNGQDTDGNGYVDDYHGWNAYNNNGNITSSQHGTHVAGTAAARGDNNLGVTGVNWGAKIMPIQGSSGNEAIVVAAYGYALTMRTLYNQTGGQQGAFVVATNASFGVDGGNPNNFPIWCGMYDEMGQAGIVSTGATANMNWNIDVTGDVPTACPSNWLISVTNTTRQDQRNSGAGYGLTTIHLGAPGTQVLSAVPGGGYSALTGTSMATPHVTGAIALLVSAMSPGRLDQYLSDPATVALEIRQAILDGTDDIGLQTVTGGRLNLYKALQESLKYDLGAETLAEDTVYTDEVLEGKVLIVPAGVTLTIEGSLTLRADDEGLPSSIFVSGTIQGEAELILEDGSQIVMRPGGRYLLFPPMPAGAGQAASFDGDARLTVPASPSFPAEALSLSAWIQPEALEGTLFELSNDDRIGLRLELVEDDGVATFRYSHETESGTLVTQDWTQTPLAAGERYHVTLTRGGEPAAVRLFVNGARVGVPLLYSGAPATGALQLHVGNTADADAGFSGLMEEVRLYNEPLSIVNVRAGMHLAYLPADLPSSLVAYYCFEDAHASLATDFSGFGNVGAFMNGDYVTSTFPVGRAATLLNALPLSVGGVGPVGARLDAVPTSVGGANTLALYQSRVTPGVTDDDAADLPQGIVARSHTTWSTYVLGEVDAALALDFGATTPDEYGTAHVLYRPLPTATWVAVPEWEINGTIASTSGAVISGEYAIGYGGFVPTEGQPAASSLAALAPVYPNPVRGQATITLDLPEAGAVTVELLDVLGRRVAVLQEGLMAATTHRIVLDGSALAPGVYVIRASGDGFSQTQRVTVVR